MNRRQFESVEVLLRVQPGQEIAILDPLYDVEPVAEEARRRAKEQGLRSRCARSREASR